MCGIDRIVNFLIAIFDDLTPDDWTLAMSRVWSIITKDKNRQIISWIGGALVAVVGAAWTVITFVWPGHETSPAEIVCAQQGSIAGGHDVSGSVVNYTASTPPSSASGSARCASADKK
jgi:hypothetical protein